MFQRRHDLKRKQEELDEVVKEASTQLAETRETEKEVAEVVARLRELREKNHFTELFVNTIGAPR